MLNDVFLYNIEDCTFWSFDTFTDFVNGFLLIIDENKSIEGMLSFAYSFHKAPVTYYSCNRVLDDYNVIDQFIINI